MNELSGFVEIPSKNLRAACSKYLEERESNITARREELIHKEMHRWIFKAKTRTEAIERLKNIVDCIGISDWTRATFKGSYWASKVEDLQDAACLAPNVLVEANMASLLKPYFLKHITNE